MGRRGFWAACEILSGPAAVELHWRQLAGDEYDAAKVLIRPRQELAAYYPCTRSYPCGCYHRVVIHSDDDIVAVCACNPLACDTFRLMKSDIIIYELDRSLLHKAIVDALSLEPSEAEVPGVRRTTQTGFYSPRSGARFPVFLTIQTEPEYYRNVAFALAAKNSDPFILITPTHKLLPSDCLDILRMKKSALFALSDMLTVNGSGKMSADPSCGAMLTSFRAQVIGAGKEELLCLNDTFFYSQDYHCVSVDDREFTLTSAQSQVIEIMCEAYRNGTPDVGKDYILEEIGSSCERLRDVFSRDLEAFKCLIRPGTRRGTYRLNI